ncbi:MAG: hypothetical protein RR135_06280 [Oscillospiraceae bacterium]
MKQLDEISKQIIGRVFPPWAFSCFVISIEKRSILQQVPSAVYGFGKGIGETHGKQNRSTPNTFLAPQKWKPRSDTSGGFRFEGGNVRSGICKVQLQIEHKTRTAEGH